MMQMVSMKMIPMLQDCTRGGKGQTSRIGWGECQVAAFLWLFGQDGDGGQFRIVGTFNVAAFIDLQDVIRWSLGGRDVEELGAIVKKCVCVYVRWRCARELPEEAGVGGE